MPIRVQMPNGTVRPFREGTPQSAIRKAQADMLADMKASGHYDNIDFGDWDEKCAPAKSRKVTVTRDTSDKPVPVPAQGVITGVATGADLNPDGFIFLPPASGRYPVPQLTPLPPAQAQPAPSPPPLQNPAPGNTDHLGDLSMQYETGRKPGQEAAAAGTVSTGKGDKGGVSYGAYQMANNAGTFRKFLQKEGKPWATRFNGLDLGNQAATQAVMKDIGNKDGDKFFQAQNAFIQRTHYDPAVERARAATGIDLNAQSRGVREATWSTAVQHGGAAQILTDAVNSLKGKLDRSDPGYQDALIDAIYGKRRDYVSKLNIPNKPAIIKRYDDENARAHQFNGPPSSDD